MISIGRRTFLLLIGERYASLATVGPGELRRLVKRLAGSRVPGVAVAWCDGADREIVVAGDADDRTPVAETTVFEAASLSKPVFALGVLSLVDRGLLDLDRPISEIVDLREETTDAHVLKITPRHALTHTSGLPNWRFRAEPLHCTFAPGARFSYSGEGIFLLQRAVERIAGTGLASYMRETVLEPLAMSSSSYVYGPQFRGRLAEPHDASGRPGDPRTRAVGEQLLRIASMRRRPLERWTWEDMRGALPTLDPPQRPLPVFSTINAASSLLTTARDYVSVMRAIARRPAMTSPRIRVAPGVAWGLGVGLDTGAKRLAFHWGDNDGFKAMMICEAHAQRGIVVLTNGDAGIPIAARIARAFFGSGHRSIGWVESMYK